MTSVVCAVVIHHGPHCAPHLLRIIVQRALSKASL